MEKNLLFLYEILSCFHDLGNIKWRRYLTSIFCEEWRSENAVLQLRLVVEDVEMK